MIKWNGSFGLKKKNKVRIFVISMFSLMLSRFVFMWKLTVSWCVTEI